MSPHANLLSFEIKQKFEFDFMWLRDNCKCEECFDPEINERNLSVLDIPNDVACLRHEVDGRKLLIECKL